MIGAESDFAKRMRWELEQMRSVATKPVATVQEGYGLILEILERFWMNWILANGRSRDVYLFLARDLIRLAATCQRIAEDLQLPVADYLPAIPPEEEKNGGIGYC